MKPIKIINVTLTVFLILLIINLFQPISNIAGSVIYKLDPSDYECYFKNSDETHEISIESCCYQIQKQLSCKFELEEEGKEKAKGKIKCFTSEKSNRFYLINQKTLNYCLKEGYDVKIE